MPMYLFQCTVCEDTKEILMKAKDAPNPGDVVPLSEEEDPDVPAECECGTNRWLRLWGRASTFRMNFRRTSI